MVTTYGDTQLIENCAGRLREGHAASYRGVNLWLAPDGCLEVRVHPSWRIEDTPEQKLLNELEFARCVIGELCDKSPSVARIVEGHPWRLIYLNEEETGTASVWCLKTGALWWSATFP